MELLKLYIFQDSGCYSSPVPFTSIHDACTLACRYCDVNSRVIIVDSGDSIVFEIVKGVVRFPEEIRGTPAIILCHDKGPDSDLGNVSADMLKSNIATFDKMCAQFRKKEIQWFDLAEQEILVQTIASLLNVNPAQYGFAGTWQQDILPS